MSLHQLLFNHAGRLRSGWRLVIFGIVFLIVLQVIESGLFLALRLAFGTDARTSILQSLWGYVIQALLLMTAACVCGWACGAALEDLPPRALGWARHRGWLRDWLMGSLAGATSLLLATLIATAGGGFRFQLALSGVVVSAIETLTLSAGVFVLSAAAEESLFRGYPLQTVLRSWPVWLALVPSSVLFAKVHLDNPNAVPGFTLINTLLAGIWLAVAYIRTRSLWFPLGLHWSWNWIMGAVLGLPVSGINQITPVPLLRAVDRGPAWLTGGAYGIEGGAACTLALLLSTLFIWRTRLIYANEEMEALTTGENRRETTEPLTIKTT
ncbi:MAG: lysostaphin resistance A-like protein [Pyrinomonadaceae bacterium]